MDPLTQGVLGVTASQVVSTRKEKLLAAVLGFFSGMAPDLDVLISSSTDPLLELEYHRHFTHSLFFIPIGGLICATIFYALTPRLKTKLSFKKMYVFCVAGYASHAVLDACTTYGTQLFWPFSNARIAWNTVSVIDPLYTVPLIILLLFAVFKRSHKFAIAAFIYAFFYIGLGFIQNHRAENLAYQLAETRGHQPINLGVKPSMANLITWKSVYEFEGRYYVDAVRVLKSHRIIEGSSTEKLVIEKHFPWLDLNSQQAKDIERFSWFSNHHLGIDPDNENRIIDIRYSLLPNKMTGMWGITLSQTAKQDEHIVWTTTRPNRDNVPEQFGLLWEMLKAE